MLNKSVRYLCITGLMEIPAEDSLYKDADSDKIYSKRETDVMKSALIAEVLVIVMLVIPAQVYSYTIFDFNSKVTNGTQYKTRLLDDDGEYLEFIWAFNNSSWNFTKDTSLSGIWDNLENTIDLSSYYDNNKSLIFIINSTLPIGEPVYLCIDDECDRT